jgi:predicted dehydrogenase
VTAAAPQSSGSVRWGILATGGIARLFTRDLVDHGFRVTAVGSRSAAGARAFADEFGISAAYGSYDELCADPDVDVVYVATPHVFHATDAARALDQGKHVLVEKPFALDAGQAREVVALARSRGLLVMEAMWTRFLPHMAFVRDVVAAGRIGAVRWLHADHTQRLPADPGHRLNDPALGGGALLDLGVYPLSFAHDLLGAPTEVLGRGTLRETGVDASIATMLRHPSGAVSTSYSASDARGPNTAVVLGSEGRIEIAPVWLAPAPVRVYDADGSLVEEFDPPVSGRGMQYQAAEVEQLVAAGDTTSAVMSPEDSIAVMVTLDQIRALIGVRYPGG